MFKRIAAVAATSVLAVVGVAGVAQANTVTDTFWTQTSNGLACNPPATGEATGVIHLAVSGNETRRVGHGFVTHDIDSLMVVEKWVSGSWRFYSATDERTGYLGVVHPAGAGYAMGKLNWNDSKNMTHPSFATKVYSSGQYRASIVTVVNDQDGYDVAHMTTTVSPTCTFRG